MSQYQIEEEINDILFNSSAQLLEDFLAKIENPGSKVAFLSTNLWAIRKFFGSFDNKNNIIFI